LSTKKAGVPPTPAFNNPQGLPARTDDNTDKSLQRQAETKVFLVGNQDTKQGFLDGCEYAATITGFSLALQEWVLIQVRCKRWGCSHCGQRKMSSFGHRVANAQPNRFVTLTVWTEAYETPRIAYDKTRRAIGQLSRKLRKEFGEFEYFRVLEVTKKGWPHYHLIVRSPYIPQQTISDYWARLARSKIVDVRKIRRPSDIYRYVVKYLGKQKYIPWTNRRVAWSRNFWKDDPFTSGGSLNIADKNFTSDHPETVLWYQYDGARIVQWTKDLWLINPSNDNPTIKEE